VHRFTIAVVAVLAAALAVVSLSAAASHRAHRAHRYHRIISLSPTATEDLFAIGAGKQVVAVDQDSNYPARAPRTSLSGYTPNVEANANYHRALVVISYNPDNLASQLKKLGNKVVNLAHPDNLKQAYGEILRLGRVTGHIRGAKAVVRSMRTHLAAIVASVPKSRRHLRVYHELDPTYFSATSKTFIGSIYKLFGFRDIADGAGGAGDGYPQLSAEYIIAKNPQIIVLADTRCCGQTYSTVAARPGWTADRGVRADGGADREAELMAATAGRVEAAPRVEARGVGLRAGLVTVAFLVVALAIGLAVGPVHIGVGAILRSTLSYVPFLHVHQSLAGWERGILWQVRAPRVVLAALVGGMLAVAGASYQGVFRNPLCDPYLLGVAGGAGLGATLAIIYASAAAAGSNWTVPLAAFAGAIAAVVVTYALGRSVGATQMTGALVLAGVTMATFTAALHTFLQQQHTQ